MAKTQIEPHATVKILVRAGCIEKGTAGTATRFCGTVEPGQTGIYICPLPGVSATEDWHVIGFGAWDVPLHISQFEVLSEVPDAT